MMIQKHLYLAMDRYPNIELDTHVIMPNHLHALDNFGWSVEAASHHSCPEPGRHGGLQLRDAVSLSRVVQWFKSATTNEYMRRVRAGGWPRFPGKLWQPNYYEHIVRDQYDLDRIRTYIAGNPGKWEQDTEYLRTCPGFPS